MASGPHLTMGNEHTRCIERNILRAYVVTYGFAAGTAMMSEATGKTIADYRDMAQKIGLSTAIRGSRCGEYPVRQPPAARRCG